MTNSISDFSVRSVATLDVEPNPTGADAIPDLSGPRPEGGTVASEPIAVPDESTAFVPVDPTIAADTPASDVAVDDGTIPQDAVPPISATDEHSGAVSESGEVILPAAATPGEAPSAVQVWPTPHALARIFPRMDPHSFAGLKASIAAEGLWEPITLHEGQVLDGCNRLDACLELGVTPTFQDFSGPGTPLEFVLSKNLHRRHMDESRRALIAARVANLAEGRPSKTAQIQAVSQDKAAEMFNISRTSVQHAATVVRRGVPPLVEAVEAGKLKVSAAARIARKTREEQEDYLARYSRAKPVRSSRLRVLEPDTSATGQSGADVESLAQHLPGPASLAGGGEDDAPATEPVDDPRPDHRPHSPGSFAERSSVVHHLPAPVDSGPPRVLAASALELVLQSCRAIDETWVAACQELEEGIDPERGAEINSDFLRASANLHSLGQILRRIVEPRCEGAEPVTG
jgi:ParB-like chromosome segregation protein Spo0J